MSRSRSARHKKSPKPIESGSNHTKSRLNKGSETRSGTVKNFDYEAHLSKNFDATESNFPKTTTAAELSGGAPDSNSRQDRFPFLSMNIFIFIYDDGASSTQLREGVK